MEPTQDQINKIEKTIVALKTDIDSLLKCSKDVLESQEKLIAIAEKIQ